MDAGAVDDRGHFGAEQAQQAGGRATRHTVAQLENAQTGEE
jgi:hypothetical protein